MGTANFYNKNASRVFAVMTGYVAPVIDDEGNETEETEYRYPEDWEWDENFTYLQEKLGELDKPFDVFEEDSHDNERNFCGRTFAEVYLTKSYGEFQVGVRVKCIRRSAYYEGACLDWEARIEIEGNDWGDEIDLDELIEEFDDYFENRGMATIQGRYAHAWLETAWTETIEAVEKKFAEACGIELIKVAQFSNGEAFYKEASKVPEVKTALG